MEWVKNSADVTLTLKIILYLQSIEVSRFWICQICYRPHPKDGEGNSFTSSVHTLGRGVPTLDGGGEGVPTLTGGPGVPTLAGGWGIPTLDRGYLPWLVDGGGTYLGQGVPTLASGWGGYLPWMGVPTLAGGWGVPQGKYPPPHSR